MMAEPTKTEGPNYTAVHLGELDRLEQYGFLHPVRKVEVVGKVFLKELLGATATEISFTKA